MVLVVSARCAEWHTLVEACRLLADWILSLGIFAVGVIAGMLIYHLVCEVKIRQLRQAQRSWHEKRASVTDGSQILPSRAKNG
jgi:uncharacterized integral membrane protein